MKHPIRKYRLKEAAGGFKENTVVYDFFDSKKIIQRELERKYLTDDSAFVTLESDGGYPFFMVSRGILEEIQPDIAVSTKYKTKTKPFKHG